MKPIRTLALNCMDWSITAAGFVPEDVVAVVGNNVVEVCSAGARGTGVRVGMRKREAQRRVPELQVIQVDPARDARMFEPVLAAIEEITTSVEVIRPGSCLLATKGPSRYFGGEVHLVARVIDAVESVMKELGAICQIGIADGPFAARLAAQSSTIVPVGETADFLAPLAVSTLDRPELTSLLTRLGIRTLGQFAQLPVRSVVGRFGPDGAVAHRLARGLDEHRLEPRPIPEDLTVEMELDPPAERVDAVAFAGRALSVQLFADLVQRSLTCTRVIIEAETEQGEMLRRSWRFDGVCTEKSLTERVRWQLEGWLSGSVGTQRPHAGVRSLRLIPDEVRPDNGEQKDLWDTRSVDDERAAGGFCRVQGLMGTDAVVTASLRGGRHPSEQVQLTAWGEVETRIEEEDASTPPWPNRLPTPSPAIVRLRNQPIEILDAAGEVVTVNRRGMVSEQPMLLRAAGSDERIVAWAGPWTSDDQWWDPSRQKRQAFMQIVTESGAAHLIAASGGRWSLDATYD